MSAINVHLHGCVCVGSSAFSLYLHHHRLCNNRYFVQLSVVQFQYQSTDYHLDGPTLKLFDRHIQQYGNLHKCVLHIVSINIFVSNEIKVQTYFLENKNKQKFKNNIGNGKKVEKP